MSCSLTSPFKEFTWSMLSTNCLWYLIWLGNFVLGICIYRYLIFATRIFIDVFVDSSVWLTIIYVFKSYIAENRPGFRDFRKFLARIQKCEKIPGSGFKNVFYWFVVRFIYMEHVDTNVNLFYVRSKTKFRGGRMESRVALKIYWRWKHRVKNSRRYGCWMEEAMSLYNMRMFYRILIVHSWFQNFWFKIFQK